MIRKKIIGEMMIEKRKCRIRRDLYFHFHASRESFFSHFQRMFAYVVESRVNMFLFFFTLQNVRNRSNGFIMRAQFFDLRHVFRNF